MPSHLRDSVKAYESGFEQLYQSAPLLSLHARFAFETLGKIGEGGMGSVYQVKDHRLNRIAALKLLSDKNATEQARVRFYREAEITAKLDHPAIPPVYETGLTSDGDLYMLMRMIRGRTLKEVIRDCHDLGAMEPRELIEIMIKVAEAVAYAHSQGIIHRDLKPDNIMVGEFGEVLVIDWGIAKDLNAIESEQADQILECGVSKDDLEQLGVTVSGTMVGTPGYMAPEQIDGAQIDERADVFALGVILVEILTGKRAVSGETTIDRVAVTASGSAMSPRDIDSSLSREIDWIAKEAMELDLGNRTLGAEDFVSQLRAYFNGDEIPGYSYSLIEGAQRTIRRHPGLIVATTVGALLFALIGNLWLTLELEGQRRQEAEANAVVATKRLGVAEDEVEKAKAILALFNEARNLVERGAPKARLEDKINEALKRGGRTENQLLTAARIYFDANFDENNKELLEEAVALYPPCYEGLFSLHSLELKLSSREFYYTSYFKKLLAESKKRGHENEFTLFADAYQLYKAGRLDESIATYSRIEEYSTSFGWMYSNRGSIWSDKKDFDKALADFNRAIKINPRDSRFFFNRGRTWKKKREFDRALADYNRAIELNPRFELAFINRGLILEKKGELGKALADYNRVLELNPRSEAALNNRGVIWVQKREFDKALADYDRVIKLNPQDFSAFSNRGYIWEKKGRLDKALADYNSAIELNPRLAQALTNRGVLLEKKGELGKALADYNRVIEINPRNSVALFSRGLICWRKGRNGEALADMTKAIQLKYKDPYVYFVRGSIYLSLKKEKEACADLERFLRLAPKHPRVAKVRKLLARARAEQGK